VSGRPLPAYARELADARRRGLTLRKPLVSVALHWRSRPAIGYGVVVPDDSDPRCLDWSWCLRLDVIVLRQGDATDRLMDALRAIEAAHPRRLVVVDVGAQPNIVSIVEPPRSNPGDANAATG
jgi:hypothetical protein